MSREAGIRIEEIRKHLVWVQVGTDSEGRQVYETRWVNSPIVNGKRISSKTIDATTAGVTQGIESVAVPLIYDIYDYHDGVRLRKIAELIPGDFDKEEWTDRFLENRTKAYEREGALYERYRSEQLKSILTKDAYDGIRGRVMEAIRKNENPDEAIRRMREDIFGLKPGERNKGVTYKVERLLRTELSHAESSMEREVLRQNPEIIGVRIRYYGGPCPQGVCLGHLHNGKNFQGGEGEATADFYIEDGIDWPPYHPNCYCQVARYLYEEDRMELTSNTEMNFRSAAREISGML